MSQFTQDMSVFYKKKRKEINRNWNKKKKQNSSNMKNIWKK